MSALDVPIGTILIFAALIVGVPWLAWLTIETLRHPPVVTPAEYESVHYLGRCEVRGCNAPARFKVESPRGVRLYCRKCLEGGAK